MERMMRIGEEASISISYERYAALLMEQSETLEEIPNARSGHSPSSAKSNPSDSMQGPHRITISYAKYKQLTEQSKQSKEIKDEPMR
jgi:hypothetical protein